MLQYLLGAALAFGGWWYYYYYIQKGNSVCIAIYPPPPNCGPTKGLPFYLPKPPLLPAPKLNTDIYRPPPSVCVQNAMCVQGSTWDAIKCKCVPICQPANCNPATQRWNWCTRTCVPKASMMPDCLPPKECGPS